MKIPRERWERVIEKACEIANATEHDDDPMYEVHVQSMMTLLDELETEYGPQSRILATRADYMENVSEQRALYAQALDLATKANDANEIEKIMDSINQLGDEVPIPTGPLSAEEAACFAKLSQEEVTEIDDAVLSCAFPRWRKVAAIVGFAMDKLGPKYPQFSEVFYAERIRVLAAHGRLESQGDLSYMRFSEVRLPEQR